MQSTDNRDAGRPIDIISREDRSCNDIGRASGRSLSVLLAVRSLMSDRQLVTAADLLTSSDWGN